MRAILRTIIGLVVARPRLVFAVVLIVLVAAATLASQLEVRADLSSLLPRATRSVRDLEAVERRVPVAGTMFVIIEAPSRQDRERAAESFARRLAAAGGSLVGGVTLDDRIAREYYDANRYLFVDLAELHNLDEVLREKIRGAKLARNPLYIDLEETGTEAVTEEPLTRLENLRDRFRQVSNRVQAPSAFVSRGGALQLVLVRASFESTRVDEARRLVRIAQRTARGVEREYGVRVGLTGNVVTALGEHESIVRGMLQALVVTIVLVLLVLLGHLRSPWLVLGVGLSLASGCALAFALTYLIVGHLNLATSFLAAIVVGNGINPGIIVASRFREEQNRQDTLSDVLKVALRGSLRGTLAASLTGAVAYGSLALTAFRGFKHFGLIGGIGMVTCWIAAYTCLPAFLVVAHRRIVPPRERNEYPCLARMLVGYKRQCAYFLSAVVLVAGATAVHYVLSDPLETDWRNLRSDGKEVRTARAWNDRLSNEFDSGFNRNLSGRFAIAGDSAQDARAAANALRAAALTAGSESRIGQVQTADAVWPPEQMQKIQVLASIRHQLTELLPDLPDEEADLAREIMPPEKLRAIHLSEVPEVLRLPYMERDWRFGRVAWASSSDRVQSWDVRDLIAFAGDVRAVPLPPGTRVAGEAFVVADIIDAMEQDIPRATLVVIAGSILCVLLVVGPRRWGWIVLSSAALGTLGMVALVALAGIRVNFLDFIALPITVGIGVDYAANLAARAKDDPEVSLSAAGAAVVVCSLTTIIGYGSLLLSENAGIRSFELAAVFGELTCLSAAFWLVGLALPRRRAAST